MVGIMELENQKSKNWLVLHLTREESREFFPKITQPLFRRAGNSWVRYDQTKNLLRRDIYEWCLNQFGPTLSQDTCLDRIYYDDNLPDIKDPSVIADAYASRVPQSQRRWSVVRENAIAFRSKSDAMLFKLQWSIM